MGGLFAIIGGLFPRLGVLFIWLARPVYFSAAFGGNWLWPLLGVIFLPFTTLMYVLLWSPGVGLTGLDWLWLLLAIVLDLGNVGRHRLRQPRPAARLPARLMDGGGSCGTRLARGRRERHVSPRWPRSCWRDSDNEARGGAVHPLARQRRAGHGGPQRPSARWAIEAGS